MDTNLMNGKIYITSDSSEYKPFKYDNNKLYGAKQYLINEKAKVVVIKWYDGTTTKSKVDGNDEFDKEIGFLVAILKKLALDNNVSKASLKREMSYVSDKYFKDYLLEVVNRSTFKNIDKLKKHLKTLKSTNKLEKNYI